MLCYFRLQYLRRLHPFCFIFPQIQTRTYLTGCLHALHLGAALADGGEFSEATGLMMMAGDADDDADADGDDGDDADDGDDGNDCDEDSDDSDALMRLMLMLIILMVTSAQLLSSSVHSYFY